MKPPVSDDVKTLFRRFGGEASTYQEVNQEQHNNQVASKWPMLMSIDPDRALVVPSVKRAVRISEVRHEVADFDGAERRMAVAVPSESSFQKKPGGRRDSDTALIPTAGSTRSIAKESVATASVVQQSRQNPAEQTYDSGANSATAKPPTRKARTTTTRKVKTAVPEPTIAIVGTEIRPTVGADTQKTAKSKSLLGLFGRIKHTADADPLPVESKGLFKRRAS